MIAPAGAGATEPDTADAAKLLDATLHEGSKTDGGLTRNIHEEALGPQPVGS